MRLILAVYLSFCLCACSVLPANPEHMSPEQLTAWAKDKNANVACGVVNSPYGRGVATYVVLDKAVLFNGTVSVDSECKVIITNETPAKK